MKATRRQFLKWSGLGAAGAVVFYGCGIPDEEIEVQSPALLPEDLVSGLEAWYATRCDQCSGGEGVIVRVIEGRAIKIEGNPDHPVNQGKTSVRCQAGLQALYNPDRIRGPLRLTGERGSGQYQEISWDEAINQLTNHLSAADRSVVLATNMERGSLGMVANEFMQARGGTYVALEPVEQTVLRAAVKDVFGQDQLPVFDIAAADHVLSFGADFLGTWLSPVHYARAYGEFRQGKEGVSPATRHRGTLTQVEPRMSMTAANADRWVYISPGYEGELALSIAYVLLSEHADRVDGSVGSANDLADFSPAKVSEKTGVSEARIVELAKELAENPRSLVIGGGSAAAHTNGLFNMKAVYTLNYLLGSVGKEGGVLFNPPSPLEGAPTSVSSFGAWQEVTEKMRSRAVSLFMVRRANPSHGLPKALDFADALQSVGTIVSFSSFMDETTVMADLILPEPTYLETWGDDVPDPGPGYQTVTLQQPIVKPFAEADTRPFGDVLLAAAAELGNDAVSKALPWRNMGDLLRENVWKLHDKNSGSVRGGTREEFWNAVLQRGGWWDSNVRGSSNPGTPPKLPTSAEEPEFEGPTGGDTFHLVPFSSLSLGEGQGANLPWLQATPDPLTTAVWHTWAEINPNRADELDIREGDVLEIEASGGRKMQALAYVNPTTPPNVIAVVFGQGHQVYGNFELGDDFNRSLVGKERGANVFDVLTQKVARIDGQNDALAWAATLVKVTKTDKWTRLSKLEGTVLPEALPGQPIVQVTRPQ